MPAITPKGAATRSRMLDVAIELMRASGLSGAGINEIVDAGRVPKGSVYHYFPAGKEQIVAEALAVYATRVRAFMAEAMQAGRTPGGKVRMLFGAFAARLEGADFRKSCAAGAVCLDLDAESEAIRSAIDTAFENWIELLADELRFPDRARARSFGGLLLTAIEGAYIRGRAEGSGEPFLEAGRWLAELAENQPLRRSRTTLAGTR